MNNNAAISDVPTPPRPRSVPVEMKPDGISTQAATEFGLVGWLEATRVRLPLEAVNYRFTVSGDIVEVVVEQRFFQSNPKPINCSYIFPLVSGAAVHRCVLKVGDRVISAQVKEKQAARAEYQAALSAGHRAGLAESERDNLFTLNLGNLQPGDEIRAEFAYFQRLERQGRDKRNREWTGDRLCVRIPTCPGVKYIPGNALDQSQGTGTCPDTDQVPDASKITPPRMKTDHAEVATIHIQGRIETGNVAPNTLSSALHQLLQREESGILMVEIDSNANHVPDRDFVLRWQEQPAKEAQAQGWIHQDSKGDTYALVRLVAPEPTGASETFHQDVYILEDFSGSMEGRKRDKSVEALGRLVDSLGDQDRVMIMLFNDTIDDVTPSPVHAKELRSKPIFQQIANRRTSGGTEMQPAVKHALEAVEKYSLQQERQATIILITDGQTGDDQGVIDAFRPYPKIRVHAIGIDTTVNDALLRSIARQQRGQVILHTPADDIAGSIQRLAQRMRQPVLMELRAGSGWEAAGLLPDLYAGETVTVSLKAKALKPALEITGTLPDGQPHTISLGPSDTTNPAVALLWAKERIIHLLENGDKAGATALSVQSNLVCVTTAFIVTDSTEKVTIAEQTVIQPTLEPLFLGGQKENITTAFRRAAEANGMLKPTMWCKVVSYVASPPPESSVESSHESLLQKPPLSSNALATSLRRLLGMKIPSSAGQVAPKPPQLKSLTPALSAGNTDIISALQTISLFKTDSGRRFLRLLVNWMNDQADTREPLVRAWIATLKGKTQREIVEACIEFAKNEMSAERLALTTAQKLTV